MGTLKIVRMTNSDASFYAKVGPFLSKRSIVAELGATVWDDPGKEWFVASFGKRVAGFAAIRVVGNHTSLVSAYVLPEFRLRGVYSALLEARLSAIGRGPVKAVATAASVKSLRKAGLKPTGNRGKFTVLERA